MKKIIILLTTLLSLNLFGGLIHPQVNTIGTVKGGFEFISLGLVTQQQMAGTLEGSIEFKKYLFKHERLNIYATGKLADEIQFNHKGGVANNIKTLVTLGAERNYSLVKFYQQVGAGLGYYIYKANGNSDTKHYLSIPLEIEVGTNYQNYLISLTLGGDLLANGGYSMMGDLTLKLGLGYEF